MSSHLDHRSMVYQVLGSWYENPMDFGKIYENN